MSKATDGTTKNSNGDLNHGLNSVLDSDDTATKDDKTGLYHASKKAQVTHDRISPFEASSNNTNENSDTQNNSIFSSDSRDVDMPRSSQSTQSPERGLIGHQTAASPQRNSAQMLYSLSDHEATDNESPSPHPSTTFHGKYRKSGPSLMTLHMFTGGFRGERAVYVPVYKRNSGGKLMKLGKDRSGCWEYRELKKLTEQEVEGG